MANAPFLLPPLSAEELLHLQKLLRGENTHASVYRRSRLIWELASGCNLSEAAEFAGLHYTNAHLWVKRFQNEGVDRIVGRSRPGRPRVYGTKAETRIIKMATSHPTDLGLGFTTWSLAKLEEYLRSRKGMENLSRETIRRVLHRHGLHFLTGQTWCESNDPDFEVKKTR
jgi:transposase